MKSGAVLKKNLTAEHAEIAETVTQSGRDV
jgi:hypothetical protein